MKTKLNLKDLKVESFVTSLSAKDKGQLKGGDVSLPTIIIDCHNSDACPSAIHTCQLPIC